MISQTSRAYEALKTELNVHFSPEEQTRINWKPDLVTEKRHIWCFSHKGTHYILSYNRFTKGVTLS